MIVLGRHLTVLWLVLLALATFRATRLVVTDAMPFGPFRGWLTERRWMPDKGLDLITCPWCMGMYVASGLFVWWLYWPAGLAPVAVILACSAVAGALAEWSG